jgi:hypothetical protein
VSGKGCDSHKEFVCCTKGLGGFVPCVSHQTIEALYIQLYMLLVYHVLFYIYIYSLIHMGFI